MRASLKMQLEAFKMFFQINIVAGATYNMLNLFRLSMIRLIMSSLNFVCSQLLNVFVSVFFR